MSDLEAVAELYGRFAQNEARGESAVFEEWAHGVAADPEVCAVIATLPEGKRQPNLVFAALRWHGVPDGPYAAVRACVLSRWDELLPTITNRATQTNEPARCATLLPLLARLEGPLALIEVGASAGLTLLPDRYSFRFEDVHPSGESSSTTTVLDPADGPSELTLTTALSGIRPPAVMPEIVWRAGLDLNPIDAADADARAWLETLVWPEQDERRDRLRRALDIAARDGVRIDRGDLVTDVAALAAEAPKEATLVVFHTAVLSYVDEPGQARFREVVDGLPGHWISNEGPAVFPDITARMTATKPAEAGQFVLALDGEPVGWAQAHGQSLHVA